MTTKPKTDQKKAGADKLKLKKDPIKKLPEDELRRVAGGFEMNKHLSQHHK